MKIRSCKEKGIVLLLSIFFKISMAVKETLARELDRKMASPTESAVMREGAKGTLRSRYTEPPVYRKVYAGPVGISAQHSLRAKRGDPTLQISMRVVPREYGF